MEPPEQVLSFILCSTYATTILLGVGCVLCAFLAFIFLRHSAVLRNPKNTDTYKRKWDPDSFYNASSAYRFLLDVLFLFLLLGLFTFGQIGIKGQLLTTLFLVGIFIFTGLKLVHGHLFSDLTRAILWVSRPINRYFDKLAKPVASVKQSKLKELEQVLENTDGETTEEDKRILQGILKFSDTTVQQIMTPIKDVVAVYENDSIFTVNDTLRQNGFSRMPVYSRSGLSIIGSIHAKDLIGLVDQSEVYWQNKIRRIIQVTTDDKIINLLEEFRIKKNHLAMVINSQEDYVGVATLEDVMEEIVGDISDEFDDDLPVINQINENLFLLEGKTYLSELIRLSIVAPTEFDDLPVECITISDLLYHLAENEPKRRDKFRYKNNSYTIESADKKRITRVKLKINTT